MQPPTNTSKPESTHRRSFLSGLVTFPLIGGGVTLIGRPAAAVPLVQAAALPTLEDPRQRARYAWEAFTSAMDELTAHAHGWRIQGAASVRQVGSAGSYSFIRLGEVYRMQDMHGGEGVTYERHREIALDPSEEEIIRSREQSRGAAGPQFMGGRDG